MLRFFCSSSEKNALGSLRGAVSNLYMALDSTAILAILILPIQEHSISFHLFGVVFDFFH